MKVAVLMLRPKSRWDRPTAARESGVVRAMVQTSSTVENALAVLLRLGENGPATALQLSQQLKLNRTVVHRLLVTLERQNFVRRVGSSYALGFALLRLSDAVEDDVRAAASVPLERLASGLLETSVLVLPDGIHAVVAHQSLSPREGPQIRYRLGFRSPLSSGGHGRAILAFSPPDVVDRALHELPSHEAKRVRASLEEIRDLGYAISTDELRSGASGLAVPVRNRQGVAVASIGIVSPAGRFPPTDELFPAVNQAALDVEHQLVQ